MTYQPLVAEEYALGRTGDWPRIRVWATVVRV
jgi:hypothetical protein